MGMWNQGGLARPGALRGKTLENVTFELSPETSMGVGLRMREVQEVGALPRPPLPRGSPGCPLQPLVRFGFNCPR